jgi:hypothetical protein
MGPIQHSLKDGIVNPAGGRIVLALVQALFTDFKVLR